MTEPPVIFISYSHIDERWKDKLAVQLRVLAKENRLDPWDDRRIAAGEDWFAEIERAIGVAHVAVLLISADFLNSDFIRHKEVPPLLARRQGEGLRVVPILVRPCPWKKVEWLAKIQMRPVDGREIAAGSDYQIDKDFASIAEEMDKLIGLPTQSLSIARPATASASIDLSALPPTGPHFFGREAELTQLDQAWAMPSTNIISLVAWGGAGKSALVNHWLGTMALENYRSAERVYGWSFYSQGTKETETSADEFFRAALVWFGDRDPKKGSPWEKGERLASLIQKQRTLLVLDGLEPLQNPPGLEGGKLKDPALAELLRHLEAHNSGLCLISTRLEVVDIAGQRHATAPVINLGKLSTRAGTALLEAMGVRGNQEELAEAVDAVDGHALALNLLGTYIRDILDRDVRRWREAGLLEQDRQSSKQGLRMLVTYKKWFAGRPELPTLRILGMFDRPAQRELVDVLRRPPVIPGLNDELVDLPEKEWRWALARLRQARLIDDENVDEIDAHPLVREHFGEWLKKDMPEAWRAGHGRLYEHLRNSATRLPDTLAEMAPLFQAMHHGCQAARHQEALEDVYYAQVQRQGEFFAYRKLGAFGADLAALAGLFERPWDKPVAALTEQAQAFILTQAGSCLLALGRSREAASAMRPGLDRAVQLQAWENAAASASQLADLHLTLGDVAEAVRVGEASVTYAEGEDASWRLRTRVTLAHALHQAGEAGRAARLFKEAEALQADFQPTLPRLYALQGYKYCELLLAQGRFADVRSRATQALEWQLRGKGSLLGMALGRLSLGRAAMALGEQRTARAQFDQAVNGLRQAGTMNNLPWGLLARAALFRETGDVVAARRDLDETMRIARRSEMRLFQCDAHLEYARLALAEGDQDQARGHVAAARRLVEETGYGRRRPEVEELEAQVC